MSPRIIIKYLSSGIACFIVMLSAYTAIAQDAAPLPGTSLLTEQVDFAEAIVNGIHKFLDREIEASIDRRAAHWNRDLSSHTNYLKSVERNRERLKTIIGMIDERESAYLEYVAGPSMPALVGQGDSYKIFAVRWHALKGVDGEGLMLQPDGEIKGNIIALPDCDWSPEMLAGLVPGIPREAQYARRLAENGFSVIVPTLIDRKHTYSGNPRYRMTDQHHREYIYRPAYELGRHIIGYEVQKIMAAVDWFLSGENPTKPVGVIGYGEGGLLAFYAAAVDTRIDAAVVSGYFQPRESMWQEPVYRNIWSFLDEFGDAEVVSLIAPRSLVIEACKTPEIVIPLQQPNRTQAAPGTITTPEIADVEREFRRAENLVRGLNPPMQLGLINTGDAPPGSDAVLSQFIKNLSAGNGLRSSGSLPARSGDPVDPELRHKRQFFQLLEHTQDAILDADYKRAEFWSKAVDSSVATWDKSVRWYRDYFWDENIGRLSVATLPPNPRTRLIYDEPRFKGYEVMLDVYPDVFAYGILLIPKDIQPGEHRPVVVCQHGLEGTPKDVADPSFDSPAYHRFACQLADRGFITYAPQNPYRGFDRFRLQQRKAHPLKKSIYSFIIRQHEQTLNWLSSLPYVDPGRIAFYGLSYGGNIALRIPAILEQYCLSICSASFNEWIWKIASTRFRACYPMTVEYDHYEFNLGNTFNCAEMTWLICPRPFMVERGHRDGVAPDEWVAYEFARTRNRFALLGIGDRTEIEYFDGQHEIHSMGTFEFLHKHLKWKNTQD